MDPWDDLINTAAAVAPRPAPVARDPWDDLLDTAASTRQPGPIGPMGQQGFAMGAPPPAGVAAPAVQPAVPASVAIAEPDQATAAQIALHGPQQIYSTPYVGPLEQIRAEDQQMSRVHGLGSTDDQSLNQAAAMVDAARRGSQAVDENERFGEKQGYGWAGFGNEMKGVGAQVAGGVGKTAAFLARAGTATALPGNAPAQAFTDQAADALRQQSDQLQADHPIYSTPGRMMATAGGMAPQLAATLAFPPAAPAIWGLTGAAASYNRAKEAGASEQQALGESAIGGAAGVLTSFIPGLGSGAGGVSFARGLVQTALSTGVQSAADDLIAKVGHGDPKSAVDILEDSLAAGGIGMLFHAIAHGPAELAKLPNKAVAQALGLDGQDPAVLTVLAKMRAAQYAAASNSATPDQAMDRLRQSLTPAERAAAANVMKAYADLPEQPAGTKDANATVTTNNAGLLPAEGVPSGREPSDGQQPVVQQDLRPAAAPGDAQAPAGGSAVLPAASQLGGGTATGGARGSEPPPGGGAGDLGPVGRSGPGDALPAAAGIDAAGPGNLQPDRSGAEPGGQAGEPSAGGLARPRPLPPRDEDDAYLRPLSHYADRLYTEAGTRKAIAILDPGTLDSFSTAEGVYMANTPALAMGQGDNKGFVIELDPHQGLRGRVNRNKPAWEPAYDQGHAEFVSGSAQADFRQAAVAVTYDFNKIKSQMKPSSGLSSFDRAQLGRMLNVVLPRLRAQGWTPIENADGTITLRKPGTFPLDHGEDRPLGQSDIKISSSPSEPAAPPKPKAPPRPFTKPDLQQRIQDIYSGQGGGVPADVQQFADSLPDAFTFKSGGQYSGEVARMVSVNEAGKAGVAIARSRAVTFTDDPARAGGEDALQAFRDRYGQKGEDYYWQIVRDRAGIGFQNALDHARNSPDPNHQLAAAIYDNLPSGKRPAKVVKPGDEIPTDTQFELNGHQMRVTEDAEGIRVLRDGDDYPLLPIDDLDAVPMDKGTISKPEHPDLPEGEVFGFDDEPIEHKPAFFDSDQAGVSAPKSGLFGQTVFDGATGNHQDTMFDTSKPTAAAGGAGAIAGSSSALDPRNTAEMFAPPEVHEMLRDAGIGPQLAARVVAKLQEQTNAADQRTQPAGDAAQHKATGGGWPVAGAGDAGVAPGGAAKPGSAAPATGAPGHPAPDAQLRGAESHPPAEGGSAQSPAAENPAVGKTVKPPGKTHFMATGAPSPAGAGMPGGGGGGSGAVRPPNIKDILFGPGSAGEAAQNAIVAPMKTGRELIDQAKRLVAPQTRGLDARLAANSLRDMMARMDMGNDREIARFKAATDMFDREPRAEQIGFVDHLERGELQHRSEFQPIADALRDFNDKFLDRIRSLGTGKLQQAYENYVGRIWKDPEEAAPFMAKLFSKKPLEGSKGFLKKRALEYFLDGIGKGLEPLTYNPIEMMLLKGAEMRRYYEMWRTFRDLQAKGLAKFVATGADAPDNWRPVPDRMFEVWAPPEAGVRAAFDAGLRNQLIDLANKLGVAHQRVGSLGVRNAWGMSGPGAEIKTRFGGPDFVIAHELGHQIEDTYHFLGKIGTDPDPAINRKLQAQLNDLADARFEHDPAAPKQFRKYVREPDEKAATVVQAYVSARGLFCRIAPDVLDRFEQFVGNTPALWDLANAEPSLSLASEKGTVETAGPQLIGKYHVPDEVAQLYDNMLAKGILQRFAPARALFGANNLFNAANLSLSPFHILTTTFNSVATEFGRGLVAATRGDLGVAAKAIASTPFAPFRDFVAGHQMIKHWYTPGKLSAPVQEVFDAWVKGGGRPRMDKPFRLNAIQTIRREWRKTLGVKAEGKPKLYRAAQANALAMTIKHAIPAAIQAAAAPVLEVVVPRIKAGAAYYLIKQELDRLPAGATDDQVRRASQRAVDMIDNRFGQVVHDNMFFPKWFKEALMFSQRSSGWNQGTLREGGGSALDTLMMPKRAYQEFKGTRKPEEEGTLSHRQAYVLGVFALHTLACGLLTYLMTGKRPEGRDWLWPRVGADDENGNPVRLKFPSYVNDWLGMTTRPIQTMVAKASPAVSIGTELAHNRDYYGTQIRDPQAKVSDQLKSVGKHLLKAAEPFTLASAQKLEDQGASPLARRLSYAGIQETSPEYSLTDAQRILRDGIPMQEFRTRTQEEADRAKAKRAALRDTRHGEDPAQALADHGIAPTGKDTREISQHAQMDATSWMVKHTTDPAVLMRAWHAMTPTEQSNTQGLVIKQLARSGHLDPDQRQHWITEVAGGGQPSADPVGAAPAAASVGH